MILNFFKTVLNIIGLATQVIEERPGNQEGREKKNSALEIADLLLKKIGITDKIPTIISNFAIEVGVLTKKLKGGIRIDTETDPNVYILTITIPRDNLDKL